MPSAELAHRLVPLDELLGALAVELVDRLRSATTWAARFIALDELLLPTHSPRTTRTKSGSLQVMWSA
jgi:hypothetical protein